MSGKEPRKETWMPTDRFFRALDDLKEDKKLSNMKRRYLHRMVQEMWDREKYLENENARLQQRLAMLERNNARMEACVAMSMRDGRDPKTIAKVNGWDCFAGELR
jgi:hypothetical protein